MSVDLGGFTPKNENDERFKRAKREFGEKARNLTGFPGLDQARALYRLMCDPSQSWHHRALATAGVLYLVIPLDCIPDFLPGGLLDDLAVILAIVLILSGVVDVYLEGEKR